MTLSKLLQPSEGDDLLQIGQSTFKSRLIIGTGKYPSLEVAQQAVLSSEAELITLALKRYENNEKNIMSYIGDLKILPNTAGVLSADDAVRSAQIARELFGTSLIKLEIITSSNNLDPNMGETLRAARMLVKEGFEVYVYCDRDLDNCLALEDIGCCAIMPLGASIGSGRGFDNLDELILLRDKIKQNLIVDAGLAVPSEAATVMEIGYDAVLVNTAIAKANNPEKMAKAFNLAVKAGRMGFLSGRIKSVEYGNPSSPTSFLK